MEEAPRTVEAVGPTTPEAADNVLAEESMETTKIEVAAQSIDNGLNDWSFCPSVRACSVRLIRLNQDGRTSSM